jgi:hypothetical protein
MGYRIDFTVNGSTMQATVRGRSRQADVIARDIAAEARRAAVKQLLIDVRGLVDRLGALGALVVTARGKRRVAVVDSRDNETWHAFPEDEARRRGCQMRVFCDPASALAWLGAYAD